MRSSIAKQRDFYINFYTVVFNYFFPIDILLRNLLVEFERNNTFFSIAIKGLRSLLTNLFPLESEKQ